MGQGILKIVNDIAYIYSYLQLKSLLGSQKKLLEQFFISMLLEKPRNGPGILTLVVIHLSWDGLQMMLPDFNPLQALPEPGTSEVTWHPASHLRPKAANRMQQ